MTERENLEFLIKESFSINDLCIKIYGYCNGNSTRKINKLIDENNIDISHFGKGKKRIVIEVIKKVCPICYVEFETKKNKKEKITCSHKCSNSYFRHGKNNPNFDIDEYRKVCERVSNSLKGRIVSNGIRKQKEKKFCKVCNIDITSKPKKRTFCSNKCRGLYPRSEETINKIKENVNKRIKNGTHSGWKSRSVESFPEKFFKRVLESNNIEFDFNKPIKKRDLGIDCSCNYFLDFYIKGTNIDLEIDGKQHNWEDRIEHDKIRDESLTKMGYDVYRIKWESINTEKGKQYIQQEINKFIKYYMKSIQKSQNIN